MMRKLSKVTELICIDPGIKLIWLKKICVHIQHMSCLSIFLLNPPNNPVPSHLFSSTWNVISSSPVPHKSLSLLKASLFFNRICKAQKLYAENGVMYLYTQKYIWKIYWTDFTKIKHFQLFTFTLNYIFPIILSSFYVLTIFFDLILKFLMVTNSFLINLHYECILLLEGNFFYRFSIFQKIL